MPDDSLINGIGSLPPLKEVIAKYGLQTKKQLGQHFILDLNLTRKVARAAGDLSKFTIVEIGPGPGGLTRALFLEGAEKVIVIERDSRCMQALEEIKNIAGEKLQIIEGDALKVDIGSLPITGEYKIVANLPYNISTPLLFKWLEDTENMASMTLMFQKEVADRISAAPHSKIYGRLSVMSQFLCMVRDEFDISPKAFVPPPKIISTVLSFTPKKIADEGLKKALSDICRAAFNQRRKTLRASLKQIHKTPEALLKKADIDANLRPENLSAAQFLALAEAFFKDSE